MATEPPTAADTFGTTIRYLRRGRGLTQRELASKIGIDFTYLSKLENGRGEAPGEETVRRLAAALEADVEELLALAGKVPSSLRDRAQRDVQFARFLRHLPTMSDKELKDIYRRLRIAEPDE